MKYKITLWVEKEESEDILMDVLNDGLCAFSVETKTNIEKINVDELKFTKKSEVKNDR